MKRAYDASARELILAFARMRDPSESGWNKTDKIRKHQENTHFVLLVNAVAAAAAAAAAAAVVVVVAAVAAGGWKSKSPVRRFYSEET